MERTELEELKKVDVRTVDVSALEDIEKIEIRSGKDGWILRRRSRTRFVLYVTA